ncbi:hypothetical protein TNCV_5018321 [Trichonephila clavipes]|nr:hypothetical protein TNCV_5018321 [Trichonephila clavipes]
MRAHTVTDVTQNRHGSDACRHGFNIALSRNIQNGTDHCRLQNSQENIFLFTSLKKRKPGFELKTSQSAVEYLTTELYTPCRRTFALRSAGTDTKMLCPEICRTVQVIPAFKILK